jgi:hypothetical protein
MSWLFPSMEPLQWKHTGIKSGVEHFFFTGAIDHAPQIFLRAFSGAGAITPVS